MKVTQTQVNKISNNYDNQKIDTEENKINFETLTVAQYSGPLKVEHNPFQEAV